MSFLRRPFKSRGSEDSVDANSGHESDVTDGSLHYVVEKGGNNSGPSCQEATGAPVETSSPLGYAVGPVTIVFLNVSKMIGTGVYSTPSAILKGTGSVGLSMIYWALGFLTSIASFSVYLEFASYFPNRSGSEVVYLEQAYPRPKWLFPTAVAFQSVALSFSSGNAIVLSQYLFKVAGSTPGPWQLKGVAVAGYTVATLATAYGLTNALYRIIFSYAGFENAFNVVNEVKNPVKQIRKYGWISLGIVTVLYILANIAYFAAVPKADLTAAEQIAASLFFANVFGSSGAVRGLNFLIALSSFGNLLTVLIGSSRMLRECGRQGVLPYPRFWASTRPFGTTLGPYLVKYILTIIMIVAPPAGDAFNFIADLQVYPSAFFGFVMSVGLYVVRWRRSRLNLPPPEFKAWDVIIIFNIAKDLYLLIMPWYPPEGGVFAGDVSFWYATYVVAGIGILLGCGVYYWLWIYVVPKARGYRIRQQVLELADGAQSHKLVKVPVGDLAEWDATHDHVGRPLQQVPSVPGSEEEKKPAAV
ncbi:High-affinity methionine permease [Colletotrichum aenigma]|uniref:High-affinity methionine permease n=1 Tax=Colletotrichum aenigma TaxID=1215731 RepID=UPI001872DFCE|nr:High-affinity methionine permease [Colletotrichum aenigma]KAF5512992.1 High-affinity methionine permease [Colletotrichum aenigma]